MFWCCCTETQACPLIQSFVQTVDGWTVYDGAIVEGGVGYNQLRLPNDSSLMQLAFQWVDSANYNYVTISAGNHQYDWALRILQVRSGVETLVTSENFSVNDATRQVKSLNYYFCLQWESGTLRVQLEQTLPADSPPASGARGHLIKTYAIPWLPATKTAIKGLSGARLGALADPPTVGMVLQRPPSNMGGCVTCGHLVDTPFAGCCSQNLRDDWQIDLTGWSTATNGRFTGCQAVANVYILQVYQPWSSDIVYDYSPEFSQDGWVYAQRGPTACDPITNVNGVTMPRVYLRIEIFFGRNLPFPAPSSACGWLVVVTLVIASNNEACENGEQIAAYWKAVGDPAACSGSHTLNLAFQNIDGICGSPPSSITIQSVSVE